MEQRQLRSGYTTGTCASAAAKAAAVFLLEKRLPGTVTVHMPEGKISFWEPEPAKAFCQTEKMAAEKIRQTAEEETEKSSKEAENSGYWQVYKDAGDDPDVTNGTRVCAGVFPVEEDEFQKLVEQGTGYYLEEFPRLYLDGGIGVGMVTKPGLSCPVGHYAVNPVPRRMILNAVDEVCKETGDKKFLLVRIAIPDGEMLAEKTFNPNLGIVGGISILGTTGIVEPMSEQALVETIRLDIRMRALDGERTLLMTPGNYGETFLQEKLGIPLGQAVKCSNFIGASIKIAAEENFLRLLFVGHIGKLVKVTGGAVNTHSRYGDRRMELMEKLAREEGAKEPLLTKVRGANTTEEALELLGEQGLAAQVMNLAARRVRKQLEMWGGGKLRAEVIVFSSSPAWIGKTEQAEKYLHLWKKQNVKNKM